MAVALQPVVEAFPSRCAWTRRATLEKVFEDIPAGTAGQNFARGGDDKPELDTAVAKYMDAAADSGEEMDLSPSRVVSTADAMAENRLTTRA